MSDEWPLADLRYLKLLFTVGLVALGAMLGTVAWAITAWMERRRPRRRRG